MPDYWAQFTIFFLFNFFKQSNFPVSSSCGFMTCLERLLLYKNSFIISSRNLLSHLYIYWLGFFVLFLSANQLSLHHSFPCDLKCHSCQVLNYFMYREYFWTLHSFLLMSLSVCPLISAKIFMFIFPCDLQNQLV